MGPPQALLFQPINPLSQRLNGRLEAGQALRDRRQALGEIVIHLDGRRLWAAQRLKGSLPEGAQREREDANEQLGPVASKSGHC
jgi:hypothetical protein